MLEKDYAKDGVARILDLLRDSFGDYFRAYYNGQPDDIPESLLPCVMVSETTGTIEAGATGTDDIFETIQIIVALNKKDDQNATPETDLTEYKLRKLVKGQDESTGQYSSNTIMYALRRYITLSDTVFDSRITTDFDIAQRGENVYTAEAYITVTLKRLAMVPVRY